MACTLCPLHSAFDPKNPCIPSKRVGKRAPKKVVFVLGQSPGKTEDDEDEVFVGDSGAMLKEGMAAAGITDYTVGNPVRCFVKSGVSMKPAWLKACRPYLEGDLERLGFGQKDGVERYILALGNEALFSTMRRRNILEAESKEQWSEELNAWVYPLRHPAAVLRAMGEKTSWMLNFKRFGKLVRGELTDKPPVTWSMVTA